MLRHLDIRDMLIVDRLELAFRPGLNVLTGETGAGKSILLDALGFVLGWRGRADLVRAGAARGEVAAEFDLGPDHAARAVLDAAGLPRGDTLILRRVNTPEGRKTAWVNDRRVGADVLRALSDVLVERHGQHDDKGLLDTGNHRAMLDAFGDHGDSIARTRAAWEARRRAVADLDAAEARLAGMRAEEDFLRHAAAELDRLAPEPGEEAALDARRRLMRAAERMRDDVDRAAQALGPNGAEGAMDDARRWLEAVSDRAEGGLDAALSALERALVELGEARAGVDRFAEVLTFNPADLEETEERLFALRALARKHGVPGDALPGLADELRAKLADLDSGAGAVRELRAARDGAEAAYARAASALRTARAAAARRLDGAMAGELAPLRMERAVFETGLGEADPSAAGTDAVAFRVATNPGAAAGPLNRIASGGELSRFLLALKVCLARGGQGITMIFDGIDRGVGGATADAVGRRLAALAEGGQVLAVTHSPQVAAFGAHHWRVEKSVEAGVAVSRAIPLAPSDRVDEVARMLAGDTVTDAARAAARALLSGR